MKNFLLSLPLLLLVGCGPSKEDKARKRENERLVRLVYAEQKVKDAVITDANVLYVGVQDDGTRRDGYAEYLCQLVRKNNGTVDRVKVVRAGSHTDPERDNAYGVLLGESICH